jgi:uncharacterized protein (DUF2267 family)
MQHDVFIGQVQHRAELPSRGDAERIARVVLETLGEQLSEGAARHLAAQLPVEIGRHLAGNPAAGRLALRQFYQRIALRERTSLATAQAHVHAVLDVVCAAVSPGAVDHVRTQLPRGYGVLFAPPSANERLAEAARRHAV